MIGWIISSRVKDQEGVSDFHWLVSVLLVSFSGTTLVGWVTGRTSGPFSPRKCFYNGDGMAVVDGSFISFQTQCFEMPGCLLPIASADHTLHYII